MTFGNKLSALRKENNYTQEQLAELLGVSRQSISKWESGTAYPETEKLIRISTLFDCSLDYLLRDVPRTPAAPRSCELQPEPQVRVILPPVYGALYGYERKSSQTFRGVPLYHINIGPGRVAHGIIAIGLIARGVVSLGLISMGILSLGVVSLGLVSIGTLAAGLLSLGAIAVGLLAFGSIAIGLFAYGSCAIGIFAAGAAAYGHIAASGDYAEARIAIGKTEAYGELYRYLGKPLGEDKAYIQQFILNSTPQWLHWAAKLFFLIL